MQCSLENFLELQYISIIEVFWKMVLVKYNFSKERSIINWGKLSTRGRISNIRTLRIVIKSHIYMQIWVHNSYTSVFNRNLYFVSTIGCIPKIILLQRDYRKNFTQKFFRKSALFSQKSFLSVRETGDIWQTEGNSDWMVRDILCKSTSTRFRLYRRRHH